MLNYGRLLFSFVLFCSWVARLGQVRGKYREEETRKAWGDDLGDLRFEVKEKKFGVVFFWNFTKK